MFAIAGRPPAHPAARCHLRGHLRGGAQTFSWPCTPNPEPRTPNP